MAAARTGDKVAAAELMPLLYGELRQLGNAMMRRQPPGHTLQATALVHEAYAKVAGTTDQGWDGRVTGSAKKVNPGVYVWLVKLRFVDGMVRTFVGDLTVID